MFIEILDVGYVNPKRTMVNLTAIKYITEMDDEDKSIIKGIDVDDNVCQIIMLNKKSGDNCFYVSNTFDEIRDKIMQAKKTYEDSIHTTRFDLIDMDEE
jgi:hypothetical protein